MSLFGAYLSKTFLSPISLTKAASCAPQLTHYNESEILFCKSRQNFHSIEAF